MSISFFNKPQLHSAFLNVPQFEELQNKDQELEEKSKQLESTVGQLARTKALLRDRDTEMESLARQRDEYMKNMAGEMELCLRELETLGQKLLEKNAQVEELRVALQEKGRELVEEERCPGGSEHLIPGEITYLNVCLHARCLLIIDIRILQMC